MSLNYGQCRRVLDEMCRYRDAPCRHPDASGAYGRQTLIERATRAQRLAAERRMRDFPNAWVPERHIRRCWVRLDHIVSDQVWLKRRSLSFQLNHFTADQKKGDRVPMLVHLGGQRYYIWNGNHRTTIAMMIGVAKIRATVIRYKKP